ncbi:MAG TPA: formylglycine-generating enzyme family protein [Candidatus Latescibacteria bacterium]|nr:formylglycine-generating enzyme family protein [Candidatus Latescibacterota bacterium]
MFLYSILFTVNLVTSGVVKPDVEGIEFVLVPGGTFRMGDIWGDGASDERPAHEVRLSDFWMSRYEITVGQFRKFVEETGYTTTAEAESSSVTWRRPSFSQDDSHPVVYVSWYDAARFCNWLSRKAGLEEVYDERTWKADLKKLGYRLPTEAEWEYAARSGGREVRYIKGDTITHEEANFGGTEGRDRWNYTSPVGSFPPNGLGLYDMIGNVWEWCNDWYDNHYYSKSPKVNSPGPKSGKYRVLRGGSWLERCLKCIRAENRSLGKPNVTKIDAGFRVVLPAGR